jgi:hypothetical protein
VYVAPEERPPAGEFGPEGALETNSIHSLDLGHRLQVRQLPGEIASPLLPSLDPLNEGLKFSTIDRPFTLRDAMQSETPFDRGVQQLPIEPKAFRVTIDARDDRQGTDSAERLALAWQGLGMGEQRHRKYDEAKSQHEGKRRQSAGS